jgi:hypothetical protein
MAEVVVATLNVSFDTTDESTSGNLKLEIDDRPDGLNNGNTSFKPGDDAYYIMYKDADDALFKLTIIRHEATAGGTAPVAPGTATKSIDENITFSNSDTGSLGYPPNNDVVLDWLGKSYELKGTTLTPDTTLPERTRSELKMKGGKKMIGILNAKYTTTGTTHKLSGVPEDFKEVLVFAVGTVEIGPFT